MQKRRMTAAEVKAYRDLARAARKLREAQQDAERQPRQHDDRLEERNGQEGAGHE